MRVFVVSFIGYSSNIVMFTELEDTTKIHDFLVQADGSNYAIACEVFARHVVYLMIPTDMIDRIPQYAIADALAQIHLIMLENSAKNAKLDDFSDFSAN